MIIDLKRFVDAEQPIWQELEALLNHLEAEPVSSMDLTQVKRLHYLYERTSADLARVHALVAESDLVNYLENLVARAYGEIHETRDRSVRFQPLRWFFFTFPQAFRRQIRCFWLALAVTLVGALFGGFAVILDPGSKKVLFPPQFGHLQMDPSERVAMEERAGRTEFGGTGHAAFSSSLMTHNTKVSIFCMATGMTYGLGTLILLFYNGVILGGVCGDFIFAGQGVFLTGWLLPHGSVEIPAILIASQAGFVLAGALIGWSRRITLKNRLRAILPDLVTLIGGVSVLLIWAGLIESFFSQFHAPVIPYALKIAFGAFQLILLIVFLSLSGRQPMEQASA